MEYPTFYRTTQVDGHFAAMCQALRFTCSMPVISPWTQRQMRLRRWSKTLLLLEKEFALELVGPEPSQGERGRKSSCSERRRVS